MDPLSGPRRGGIHGPSVHGLHATVLPLPGFGHEKFTVRTAGRDFLPTDVHGRVVRGILA